MCSLEAVSGYALQIYDPSTMSASVLGRVSKVPPGLRRRSEIGRCRGGRTLATLSELPKYVQYEGNPPPCDRTYQASQALPSGQTALLSKHALVHPMTWMRGCGATDWTPCRVRPCLVEISAPRRLCSA